MQVPKESMHDVFMSKPSKYFHKNKCKNYNNNGYNIHLISFLECFNC
jgi:hypothetical protein